MLSILDFSKRGHKISVRVPRNVVLLPLSDELPEKRCCLSLDIVDEVTPIDIMDYV